MPSSRDGTREPDGGVDVDYATSPAGHLLAVVVQPWAGETEIEVWERAGTRLGTLDGPGVDDQPVFSPDGAWVVFVTGRSGDPDPWVAQAYGSEARRLTSDPAAEWLPRWLP